MPQEIYSMFHIDNRYVAICLGDRRTESSGEVKELKHASLWVEDHFVATAYLPLYRGGTTQ